MAYMTICRWGKILRDNNITISNISLYPLYTVLCAAASKLNSTRLIGFKRYLLAELCVICYGQILSRSTGVKRQALSISVITRLEGAPISTGNIHV